MLKRNVIAAVSRNNVIVTHKNKYAFVLAVRGFPNLFLTVVYSVVYRNVGVNNSQSERRYLYFIE